MQESSEPRDRMIRRAVRPLQEFINTEVLSGLVLLLGAVVAMAWANSPWDESYADVFGHHIKVSLPLFHADESIQHWINDGLMALFFFVVGLEIKRELLRGELQGVRKAALPGLAALGGMLAPALIFTAINAGGDGARGWGIPMATDIAFVLGILALLGSRVPSSVRVFLLALAIVDDIGAIAVIAIFYSGSIQVDSLALAVGLIGLMFGLQRVGLRPMPIYIALGVIAWAATYESGIHATIAGVALGLLTPFEWPGTPRATDADGKGPLRWLEHNLHPVSSFAIVPLFALANAGVALGPDEVSDSIGSAVTLGVMAGLVIGKPVGIFLLSWLAVRLGVAALPEGARWGHIAGVGALGGVGFTVALFVNELAFDSAALVNDGKIGIIFGSLVAGVLGVGALVLAGRPRAESAPE